MMTPTPCGTQLFLKGGGDLAGKPLLNLQAARVHVHEPGHFAESDDFLVRNVGDVAFAEERQQVVLAQAIELDVSSRRPFRRSTR